MRSFRLMALLAMCLMLLAAPVQAKTTITFWHGMGGELGEITDEMIKEFNASQDKYEVKGVYKPCATTVPPPSPPSAPNSTPT